MFVANEEDFVADHLTAQQRFDHGEDAGGNAKSVSLTFDEDLTGTTGTDLLIDLDEAELD